MSSKSLLLSVHCTNDFQELPAAICVRITDSLIQAVERMIQCVKDNELSEVGTYWDFTTPKVLDETLAEELERAECLEVESCDYDETDDIDTGRGHKLWAADRFLWFSYYDKYSDAVVESAMISVVLFNALVGPGSTPAKAAA